LISDAIGATSNRPCSLVFGLNAQSICGDNNIAIGTCAFASNTNGDADVGAIGIGSYVRSDGIRGIAIGDYACTTGGSSAFAGIALGVNTVATRLNIAIGTSAEARAESAIAIGVNAKSCSDSLIVIGSGACGVAGQNNSLSTVIGNGSCTQGIRNVVLGSYNCALQLDSIVIGRSSISCSCDSIVIGMLSCVNTTGSGSIVLGKCSSACASDTTVIGACSSVTHCNATVIGSGLTSQKSNTVHVNNLISYGQGASIAHSIGSTGGAVVLDWDNGNIQTLTLTSNITSLTKSNPIDGGVYTLFVKQGVSGRTVAWGNDVFWAGGTGPTLSGATGATDAVSLVYIAGVTGYYGNANLNFA
jgi:hypothetical protein